jgi:hypothetical protein
MRKYFGRNDIILTVSMLLVSIACIIAFALASGEGSSVLVYVDGTLYGEYDLADDITLLVEGYMGGSNRLVISDGAVFIDEASCPDKLCVHQGRISKKGEELVCLPNRVIVRIEGEDDRAYDAITR